VRPPRKSGLPFEKSTLPGELITFRLAKPARPEGAELVTAGAWSPVAANPPEPEDRGMKTQFRLIRRNSTFYVLNKKTRELKKLRTTDRAEAQKLVQTYNDSVNMASLNLELARVHMAALDPEFHTRTWQDVFDYMVQRRGGENRRRWSVAVKDKSLDGIRHLLLVNTLPVAFDKALAHGKPSTNVYLRRIHNFALDMHWILRPVLAKAQWPKIIFKKKRAITSGEHLRIIEAETAAALRNQSRSDEPHYNERRDFYELLWHTGASQSDAAFLAAEDINWNQHTITYGRQKLAEHESPLLKPAIVRFGHDVAALLQRRPASGPLFPYLRTVRPGDRATEFKQRCQGLKIEGVTLHSYRYAWAERARQCGYSERFAQEALGHNSKAVHRAYAKRAQVEVPPLEQYERNASNNNIVKLRFDGIGGTRSGEQRQPPAAAVESSGAR
jgi:integrase